MTGTRMDVGAGTAELPEPLRVAVPKELTTEAATKAAQATLDAAEKENQRVSVAVVDRNGNTVVVVKGGPRTARSPR